VLVEHCLDLRCARAPVEPPDGLAVLDQHEGRHALDRELLNEVGALVDVEQTDLRAGANSAWSRGARWLVQRRLLEKTN